MSINVKTADVILNNSFPYRRRQKSRPAPIVAKKHGKTAFRFCRQVLCDFVYRSSGRRLYVRDEQLLTAVAVLK